MNKYTLLTGVTGLVGRYLLRDFSLRNQRLAVVVRPGEKETAAERIERIIQFWENELAIDLPRLVVLEGDVTEPHLGLDAASRRWVSANCHRVLHNAATLTFHGSDRSDEPWRTNLGGTKNVLDLCQQTGISDLHYVSTAYVSGLREGTILETEFDCGQKFRNDYEESKFLAEKMVREAPFIRLLTVYRPAVIAGDSVTGYTSTYHGLYMYMQMIAVVNRHTEPGPDGRRYTPVRLEMTGEEPRNIIPVDWVSAVICHLASAPEAWGRTFHLSPDQRMTPRQMIEAGYKYFNSYGVEFCGPRKALDHDLNPLERAAYENKTIYNDYETSDPEFDTTHLRRFAPHLPCPIIDEAMFHRFWQFGEQDKWGRRRQPKTQVAVWAHDLLPSVVDELVRQFRFANHQVNSTSSIGIEVSGRGGGQWKWTPAAGGKNRPQHGTLEIGLPAADSPVLRISVNRLYELATADEAVREIATTPLDSGCLAPALE